MGEKDRLKRENENMRKMNKALCDEFSKEIKKLKEKIKCLEEDNARMRGMEI